MQFGKLKIVSQLPNMNGNSRFFCQCACGRKHEIVGYNLKNGHTTSCGCARVSALKRTATKHGMFGTRFYNIYRQILRRCNEPKHKAFKNYGGRGVKNLWQSFDNFKRDMYRSYNFHVKKFGERNTTIDRISSEGNYCKENCRWATWKIQANNKRK